MKFAFMVLVLLAGCYEANVAKQTVIRPKGVITQPNQEGELPPGSLSVGDNIRIRRQSVIEPRPAFENTATGVGSAKIWPADNGEVFSVSVDGTNSGLLQYSGGSSGIAAVRHYPGKSFLSATRDRFFITTGNTPPRVFDLETDVARYAGLPAPLVYPLTSTGGSDWLADNYIGFKAVFRRTIGDYVIRGPTSAGIIVKNSSGGNRIPLMKVSWEDTARMVEGTVVEFYRTEQQDDADLVGDRYRQASEWVLTSSDITAGFIQVFDKGLDAGLSADLYTNGSQEGASKNNYPPPVANDVVTFNDATFYVAPTSWPTFATRIPHTWGVLSTAEERTYGIGSRATTANSTNLSANIVVADATGLVVGQVITTSIGGLDGATVTAVAGTTVTLSTFATATVVGGAVTFTDVISIDNVEISAPSPYQFIFNMQLSMINADIRTTLFLSPTVVADGSNTFGPTLTFVNLLPEYPAFTISATNGQNYSPPLPTPSGTQLDSDADPRTNRLYFSKVQQPEAVPPDNYLFVGKGVIYKLWATQENLFAFCSDGIFRISGDGDDWEVTPVDPDTILLAPDAVDSIDNNIYALTTAGLISLTDAGGVQKISAPLIGEDIRALWTQFQDTTLDQPLPYTWNVQVACDKYRSEVWLNFYDLNGAGWAQTYIWNTDTNTFVTQSTEETSVVAYLPYYQSIAVKTNTFMRLYDPDLFMAPTVVFNSVFADDLGVLKQWIDVTLFLEDWSSSGIITPQFEGVEYGTSYTIAATAGSFDHVIVPLQDFVYNKHMRFGFSLEPAGESAPVVPNWVLKGVTFRYRNASNTLRQ